jgi:purine-binding chemotaxis protein CheW
MTDVRPWLICRSGAHFCALPLGSVVETLRPLPVEPISSTPAFVRGISLIRGRPTPVVDLGALLGEATEACTRFVSLSIANRGIALAVGAVWGIRRLGSSAESGLPPLLKQAARDMVSAVGILDRKLLLFLETTRMVPPDVLERLARGPA